MSFDDFMAKVRHWDSHFARWMMRHFYILFFEAVLVIVFFWYLFTLLKGIDAASQISSSSSVTEQLLLTQSTTTLIIALLLLLNSFWMLYIFNHMDRLRVILKDISYNISRRRDDRKPNPQNN